MAPKARRQQAWTLLSRLLDRKSLSDITRPADLVDIESLAEKLLAGQVRGRLLIDVDGGP